jgi:cytosine permease
MSEAKQHSDAALDPVPIDQRQHWVVPTLIFSGLEFAVSLLIVGAALVGSMSLAEIAVVLLVAMTIQWAGNALQGYLGASTGLPCAAISRYSFGSLQSRIVLGLTIGFFTLGWGAITIELAAEALSALLGTEREASPFHFACMSAFIGFLYAAPAIRGYISMKWVDFVAVPAGFLLIATGLYLAFKNIGLDMILSWSPENPKISFIEAVSIVIGLNVAQWLIASDYTRYSKPRILDQALIPLGIVAVGIPLLMVGAIMSVGVGTVNIVEVMQELGYPLWGYAILLLALGTSMLVNCYSMGLAMAHLTDIHHATGRAWMTSVGTLLCVIAAIIGVLGRFEDFLFLLAVLLPPIVGVMFADFYVLRRIDEKQMKETAWNLNATFAVLIGLFVGYGTQYVWKFGIPAVQSLVASIIIYTVLDKRPKIQPLDQQQGDRY